jgi:uncharacterized protein with von Willebrand factor type A (vWA) domain
MADTTAFDWSAALILEEKFTAYSMNPSNTNNLGKHKAFQALGYKLDTAEERAQAAGDVIRQLRASLPPERIAREHPSQYGARVDIRTQLTGPNGTGATLVTVWQADNQSNVPRLITSWAEVHVKGGGDAKP